MDFPFFDSCAFILKSPFKHETPFNFLFPFFSILLYKLCITFFNYIKKHALNIQNQIKRTLTSRTCFASKCQNNFNKSKLLCSSSLQSRFGEFNSTIVNLAISFTSSINCSDYTNKDLSNFKQEQHDTSTTPFYLFLE